MTGPYEWNPLPRALDVRCPRCGALAAFEHAEVVRIERREDVPFFQSSSLFDYQLLEDASGHRWHGAFYYALLHGPAETTIRDLPGGYHPSRWSHSQIRDRRSGAGAVACAPCGLRARHILRWPDDAWFQLDYRGHVLWAFHRESAVELRDYVAATDRHRHGYRWELFLRHVPTVFLTAKARATVVKRLDRLLCSPS